MKTYQRCLAERRTFKLSIPSNTKEGVRYDVEGAIIEGRLTCSCPAFTYKGSCSHTKLETELCGWDAAESSEAQTLEQKRKSICPRCGSRTVKVARGAFLTQEQA